MRNPYLILLFIAAPILAFSQELSTKKIDQGIWVTEGSEKVLFYQAATKDKDGKYARANYVHPLYNVDGYELTEDFPKDHLHHRGIFWTWHQVKIGDHAMGDAWECKDFVWDVVEYGEAERHKSQISVKAKVHWKSPLWLDKNSKMKAFLEENTTITVHESKGNYRLIDFEISLLALEPNLMIGGSNDHKGYGGFSPRIKMPKDILFSSVDGVVEPKTEQVTAGPWMNISGSMAADDGHGGVIIMNHADNPMFPEMWILRKKGSMQNPVYPGHEPTPVSTENPTVLRYRLVVYTGDMRKDTITDLFNAYK